MKRKLNQMDDVIRNISRSFDNANTSSLLVVIGDHGMTQQGDHGGDEVNELETAMFVHTNKIDYFSVAQDKLLTVSQIDLVPTLSWFLHTMIPFSSLGMMMIDLIPVEQRYLSMKLNFEQMEAYLQEIAFTLPLSDRLQELRAHLRTVLISFDRQSHLPAIEQAFKQFQVELQAHFRRQWSTFNVSRILLGLLIMSIACTILFVTVFNVSSALRHRRRTMFNATLIFLYVAISFSNSFIINEGLCLHFLIQTLILLHRMDLSRKCLLSFLVLTTRAFLICREEQQPYCIDPAWLLSKSSEESSYFLLSIAALSWTAILLSTGHPTLLLSGLSLISVVAYWLHLSHALSIFYLTIIVQSCMVVFNRARFDTLIYSIFIFVIGYRFASIMFLQYFIYHILLKDSNGSDVLLLTLLADYFFYATGHQPVLSLIRWTAAFPTMTSSIHPYLSLVINSLVVRGGFVLLETFSGQIFNVICIRQMLKTNLQQDLFKHVLVIDAFKLSVNSFSVFLLRRHLMLWKIFCPRFLFQIVAFIVKCLFVLLTQRIPK